MNAIVQTTLIGLLGTGLLGLLFHYLRDLSTRFSRIELAVTNLGTNVTSELKDSEIRLSDKFAVELKALDTKFTGQITAQGQRIDRIYDVLLEHSERLARIESKLDIDPPPRPRTQLLHLVNLLQSPSSTCECANALCVVPHIGW